MRVRQFAGVLLCFVAFILTGARSGSADVILETQPHLTTHGGALSPAPNSLYGVRFDLTQHTTITTAGVQLYVGPYEVAGTVFLGIIRVDSVTGLPQTTGTEPVRAEDILASAVLPAPTATWETNPLPPDVVATFNVELAPGSYAFVVSKGRFGSTPSWLNLPLSDQNQPRAAMYFDEYGWRVDPVSMGRFFVYGVDHTSAAVLSILQGLIDSRASQASLDALSTSVGTLGTQLTAQLVGLSTAVSGLTGSSPSLANLDAAISTRASQSSIDLALRVEIEKALDAGARVSLFMRPESANGHLGLVRQIVHDTVLDHQAMGEDVSRPQGDLASGDAALVTGDYKTAYAYFARAYSTVVK